MAVIAAPLLNAHTEKFYFTPNQDTANSASERPTDSLALHRVHDARLGSQPGEEMRIVLVVVGVLAAIFGGAQFLQLLGLFGSAGIGITAGAFAVAIACLRKAFKAS